MSSSNVTAVTNHFPTANEGFITTLGSTILSGAVTVPLTSTSGLTNGTVFVGIIEPGTVGKEQTFTGIVDTGGNQITGVKWTRGSNTGHNAGVTIVDYVSGTGQNMMTKGWLVEHKQNGTHEDITADSVTATVGTFTSLSVVGTASAEGWSPLGATPDTVTANGNRSYTLVFNSNDLTDTISEGMRVRTARTVAAPSTSFSLDGTNDYYVKTSPNKMTFTDDFTVSAWVYQTAYQSENIIVSRYNGTSGWELKTTSSGQVQLVGYNAGGGNNSYVQSYQSIPLNKWVHVSAQLDMSTFTATTTTSYIMINGVDVPASVVRNGSNPTALIQAGNLEVGSRNGGTAPFLGYLDQVAVYSAKVTQATILASMNQKLAGTETNLASAYGDGSVNDLNTTTPNNLTATNGATTVANSPFGNRGASTTLDYGVVMKKAFSTNTTLTIQVPEGCTIPTSGGVASVDYSTQAVPYGFPAQKSKWVIETSVIADIVKTSPTASTWYNQGLYLSVPIGEWIALYNVEAYVDRGSSGDADCRATFSTANNSESDVMSTRYTRAAGSITVNASCLSNVASLSLAAATIYYLNMLTTQSSVNQIIFSRAKIYVENAYI